MIEIGKIGKFTVDSEVSAGFFLKDIESTSEVFMPYTMSPEKLTIGEKIKAFVYLDTKGVKIASSEFPYATVGEYALMQVVETQEFGAFFDWGINKDLLVPGNEQKEKVKTHEEHLVRVCLEEGTDRVFGTTKLGKYIESSEFDIKDGDKVEIEPVQKTDLGYRCIINRKFIGMIYHSEIFKNIVLCDVYNGVVKKIREDGLVDAALQIQGIKNLDASKVKIMEMLHKRGGHSHLSDKSSPEEIKQVLGMSKKTFKNAIGMLYNKRKITISKDGITLIKKKK